MAKKPRNQQRTDATRVPRRGSGKLDRIRHATRSAPPTPPAETPPSLEQIRERLLRDRELASSEVARLGRGTEHENNAPGESPFEEGDVAQASEHRDMTFLQRERLAQRIARLDRALARLAANTYGICEACGRPIAAARLAAAPEVALCRDCQEQHERAA